MVSTPWGFHAHKEVNYLACFTLPPEMFGFYKSNIDYIQEFAVRADQRRYAIEEEAPRHYIDLDHYEKVAPIDTVPMRWDSAVAKYGEGHLKEYGIVPWHVQSILAWLTKAMKEKDYERIIKLSADLGHYIADAHVPLHTTENIMVNSQDKMEYTGFGSLDYPKYLAKTTTTSQEKLFI